MAELDSQQTVTQNLKDAGCSEALIQQFWTLIAAGERSACLSLLSRHRQCLLDGCHEAQRRIDCLDYLIYQMERDQRGAEELLRHPLSKKAH